MHDRLRLGVNIDHVATLRNARGGAWPCPVEAALVAQKAGADGITAHLREDRRHIRDGDVAALMEKLSIPLNFEMAATEEMIAMAEKLRPHAACLVPEKREELTTEGGLDVLGNKTHIALAVKRLSAAGCRVSLFIDADEGQIRAAKEVGAPVIEIHTGSYADAENDVAQAMELRRIQQGAALAHSLGIEVHAGHGLNYANVGDIAAIPELRELNIGHFLMGAALFEGLDGAVKHMRRLMGEARLV